MTIECAIKELKEDIDLYIPLHGTIDDVDRELPDGRLITALEIAIASLEAWGEIKAEIDESRDALKTMIDGEWFAGKLKGLDCAVAIIDKHLQEIKNG